ncbi:hypothetical protein [Methanothrix sp.]|uniref:hypothetical protein n=1 Tax=Methanothrix sp. TaxID=90426 RepID=UPI0025DE8F2E|nr:hypothetical protein [Methanothrix sp.]
MIALLLLLVVGLAIHWMNFERIYRRLSELSSSVSRDELYEKISTQHGSNFSAMASASWVAFFVALVYNILPPRIPKLLSLGFPMIASYYGLVLFAVLVAIVATIFLYVSRGFPVWLRLSDIYSIYPMSLNDKRLCTLSILLLWISSISSIYNSISYPYVSWMSEIASWLLLLVALVLLFIPVFKEFLEASR